jgi:hypothetical protein
MIFDMAALLREALPRLSHQHPAWAFRNIPHRGDIFTGAALPARRRRRNLMNWLRVIGLLAVAGLLALAADVTGKWTTEFTTPSGQTRTSTMDLKADGDKLTGKIVSQRGETEIQEGVVKGDEISFVVVRNFGGNDVRMNYKGKVEGDTIKFTVTAGDREFEMVAKRAGS